MNTKEIPITQLNSADYVELKRLGNMKIGELRSAVYNDLGGSYGRKGEWTLERISKSPHWSKGEMIAHLFNQYLLMKANGTSITKS